jgi:hypothetical protein
VSFLSFDLDIDHRPAIVPGFLFSARKRFSIGWERDCLDELEITQSFQCVKNGFGGYLGWTRQL